MPVYRVDFPADDPRAAKLMVLDNTVARLAEDDDAQLAGLLASLRADDALMGTGYGDDDVAALLEQLRAQERIPDLPPELDPEGMDLQHVCPKCGYEFDDR